MRRSRSTAAARGTAASAPASNTGERATPYQPTSQAGEHGGNHEGGRAPPTHRQRRDDLGKRHRGIHRHGLFGRLLVRRLLLLLGGIGRMVNQFAAVYAHVEKLTPFIEVGVQLE